MVANDIQIKKALDIIRTSGKNNISLLGLSFKAGTDDVRESPLLNLAEKLIQDNYQLKIYDPNVSQSQIQASVLPSYISECLCPDADDFIRHGEFFIIGHSSDEYNSLIKAIEKRNTPLLDLVRKAPSLEKKQGYHGICWA
jgi:GDP-mannose 6-dehydrogenase